MWTSRLLGTIWDLRSHFPLHWRLVTVIKWKASYLILWHQNSNMTARLEGEAENPKVLEMRRNYLFSFCCSGEVEFLASQVRCSRQLTWAALCSLEIQNVRSGVYLRYRTHDSPTKVLRFGDHSTVCGAHVEQSFPFNSTKNLWFTQEQLLGHHGSTDGGKFAKTTETM